MNKALVTFKNLTDNIFFTRRGDIEVTVTYDNARWKLDWVRFNMSNQCSIDWWCAKLDCDLDDLAEEDMLEDEYCQHCPRILVEEVAEESCTSDEFKKGFVPNSLEEVRIVIIAVYSNIENNYLKKHHNLYEILHSNWQIDK